MSENEPVSKVSRRVHLWPLVIIVAGVGACFAAASLSRTYWDFLGVLLILSLATLLGGALMGFLFGIPKLNRNYIPSGEEAHTTKYTPNTNLEDVSDWLTKIIIGVTLTQLTKIPDYLQSMTDTILQNSNCETLNCNFAGPVIISLFIYFFIAGFLTGYYYTRLFLPNLFAVMEENSIKREEIAIWREGAKKTLHNAGVLDPGIKINSLTDKEIKMLKKIKAQNNLFTELHRLRHDENAAVNVLLAKGIVEADSGPLSHGKGSLRITDDDLLQSLQ